jgi:hypothetical protein
VNKVDPAIETILFRPCQQSADFLIRIFHIRLEVKFEDIGIKFTQFAGIVLWAKLR